VRLADGCVRQAGTARPEAGTRTVPESDDSVAQTPWKEGGEPLRKPPGVNRGGKGENIFREESSGNAVTFPLTADAHPPRP